VLGVLLTLHSILRWVVVIAGLVAFVWALAGWLSNRSWTATENKIARVFSTSMELQVLVGIVLYVVSPLVMSALADFGGAMRNSTLRFFAVEHVLGMIFALGMIHMGRVLGRRAKSDAGRHRMAAIFNAIALIVILLSIPWPFTAAGAGRPWFRL
jgi:hypothetical protein